MRLPLFGARSLSNKFIITYSALGVLTFDPVMTTKYCQVSWKPDDAPETVTLGTSHSFSYVPTAGTHTCVVTVYGGLSNILTIDLNADGIISFPFWRFISCTSIIVSNNSSLVGDLGRLPSSLVYASFPGCPLITGSLDQLPRGLGSASFAGCLLITGSLDQLPSSLTYASFGSCTLITGSLAQLPSSLTSALFGFCSLITGSLAQLPSGLTYALLYACPLITGSVADLPVVAQTVYLYQMSLVTAGTIAPFTALLDFRLYSNGWNQAAVDSVIDSAYQAVLLDPNHYTATHPTLNIGGTNAAPSGIYQFADPPTTGLEKVYYLCHLASHSWIITWNGGSGP